MTAPDQSPSAFDVVAAGFFTARVGIGQAARNVVGALRQAGLRVASVEPVVATGRQGVEFPTQPPVWAPVNLVCVNPPELPLLARAPLVPASDRKIGLWFWELDEIPDDWVHHAQDFDELWVTCRLTQIALQARTPVPVRLVPLPVELPATPARDCTPGTEPNVRFLTVIDYLSTSARKNPLGAIDAFTRAFGPDDGPELVVKTLNAEFAEHEHREVLDAANRPSNVHVLDGWLPGPEFAELLRGSAAVLSLHRSEGFGLPVAEAMLHNVPVVTTEYGGVLEYATEENAFLVSARRVAISNPVGPYPAGAQWAEPDIDHAARLIRHVVEHPSDARERAARGAADVEARYAPDVAGPHLAQAVSEVLARPRRRARPRISVVLPIKRPWPFALAAFQRVKAQAQRVGGEVVVVDGHGNGLADHQAGGVVLLRQRGADMFQLRNLGIEVADGSVVAFTEDHCIPGQGWCEGLLSAHGAHADADAVIGAVRNGSTSTLADRANFLATFGVFTPPLITLPPNRVPPMAGLSFRREALADVRRPGDLELVLLPHLLGAKRLVPGDGTVVEHNQSHGGLLRTVAIHFHNGRAIGGLSHGKLSRTAQRARIHSCLRFPRTIVSETRAALRQRGARAGLLDLAVVCVLGIAHAAGHVLGLYRGPGASAQRLQ